MRHKEIDPNFITETGQREKKRERTGEVPRLLTGFIEDA